VLSLVDKKVHFLTAEGLPTPIEVDEHQTTPASHPQPCITYGAGGAEVRYRKPIVAIDRDNPVPVALDEEEIVG
jgi:hypothetical protein